MRTKLHQMLALILALAALFTLTACGSSSSSGTSSDGASSGASSGSTSEDNSETEEYEAVGDPVNLVLASSYKDTDAEGTYLNYFMDYCTEHSGGTITFTTYMAGTIGTSAEELSLLQNGDVDVIAIYAPVYAFELPEFTCILNAVGSVEDSIDFFHYICYDNEETATLYTEAAARYNATLLGAVFAVGRTVFPCTKEVSSWYEMRESLTLGAISSYPEMEGYTSYSVIDATSYYESLRTGLVQCVETSVDSAMTGKLYEVAPYVISTQIYSPFNHMAMNTDTYNSLSEEQQAIVLEAAAAAEAYSMEVCDASYDEFVETVEAEGGYVIDMTEEELDEYWDLQFKANYSTILTGLAPAAGAEEQAEIIIGTILDYWETGYTTDQVAAFAS